MFECCSCTLLDVLVPTATADFVMTSAECVERSAPLRVSMGAAAAAALGRSY